MDCLTPVEITAALTTLGQKKLRQPYYVTFFKGVMAGWMVCFGAIVVQLVTGGSGDLRTSYPGLINLAAAIFFPIGLIMLVMTGQDLLTANFMVAPMALMKGRVKWWELFVNWFIVFWGNLAGSLCTVFFLGKWTHLYSTTALKTYSAAVAVTKTGLPWGSVLLRGVGCNFLVCYAVLLASSARDTLGKIVSLWFPVFVFVFCGFEHVVVNMYYVPMGMVNGAPVSVGKYIARSLIPSFIGNLIAALILGLPMVLFYTPAELPIFFDRLPGRYRSHGSPADNSVIVHRDEPNGEDGSGRQGSNGSTVMEDHPKKVVA